MSERSIVDKFRALSCNPKVRDVQVDVREQFVQACLAACEMYENGTHGFFSEATSFEPARILTELMDRYDFPPKATTLIYYLNSEAWSIHCAGEEYWETPSFEEA